jgi:hypothetical protein
MISYIYGTGNQAKALTGDARMRGKPVQPGPNSRLFQEP